MRYRATGQGRRGGLLGAGRPARGGGSRAVRTAERGLASHQVCCLARGWGRRAVRDMYLRATWVPSRYSSWRQNGTSYAPLRRLHDPHRSWMLLTVFVPPRDHGILWSKWRSSVAPHCTHLPWSRTVTAILTSCGMTRELRSPGAPRVVAAAGSQSCQPGGGGGHRGSGCHPSSGDQPGGGGGQPGGGLSCHWPFSGADCHDRGIVGADCM